MYQHMCFPPRVRSPPLTMALLFCCCGNVIYILFIAFSIGMLILIYIAHSWIGTLYKNLGVSLGIGFPHSLALYPPSTTPLPSFLTTKV